MFWKIFAKEKLLQISLVMIISMTSDKIIINRIFFLQTFRKKSLLFGEKQLVITQRNRVNEKKRQIARKQSTDPRTFCMVSKKIKRNEQHNPLSPLRKRKVKERR